jgi:hypothetical protein
MVTPSFICAEGPYLPTLSIFPFCAYVPSNILSNVCLSLLLCEYGYIFPLLLISYCPYLRKKVGVSGGVGPPLLRLRKCGHGVNP